MSLWHLACEKRSFTWATKYIKSICTTLLSLCIYCCAPQFTVLHRIVPECFTHHILHLLLRHVFLSSGSKQINHKKSCTTQLHNTAPLARNWSALGICCTEREREKMTDITEVVKKNSTFSKETNIKKIATKLSWRTKQTHKHANIWYFFTDAFVSYLQDYVKCKYSQIFGWSIHWQKVLCSYLLVELHRLKLESSQLAFDFEQLNVQLLIGGPRTNIPTTTCRWCTNIENLISKFLVELHFANLELGGLIISSKSDEWLDIVQQVPQRIIYSWKRWKRAKSRQFLEMGIFIAYQWDPIHSIPWSWNNNLFQFSFFCRSQPASCSPL